MYKNMNLIKKTYIMILGILMCVSALGAHNAKAAVMSYYVPGDSYELADGSEYNVAGTSKEELCFGRERIGSLAVQGDNAQSGEYGDYAAYGAKDELALSYLYDGSYQTKDKEAWNLTESDSKKANGISLDKKVNMGAVIVQKSANGRDWSKEYSATDIFDGKKGLDSFYKISMDDVRQGTYYRVFVVYRMKQKVGEEKKLFIKTDVFQYKEFVETYEFFVCYGGNAVEIRDITTGKIAGATVTKGFVLDKCGTDCRVTMSKNGGVATVVESLTSVTEPGNYKIEVTNALDQSFEVNTSVSEGTDLIQVLPKVYEGGEKGKYDATNPVVGLPSFGMPSFSKLKIGCQYNSKVTTSDKSGYDAYGITGDSVSLYLQLADTSKLRDKGWGVHADEYGEKEKEIIEGVQTGEVATGALIIQKSSNGTEWENIDQGRYAAGLYTTDFYNYYGDKGDVYIYSPDGNELLEGLYLRVIYAYELKAVKEKTYNRCLEVYDIYLCSSELGAVTFHNLTVTDEKIKEVIGEDNHDALELYKSAETLVSGSGTVTGFSIDTSKNPTVTYTVKRNGQNIAVPYDHRFTTDGKYDIELKSAVGNTDTITIYVDKSGSDEALARYFGTGFINGKRVFAEDNFPVYEGGETNYEILKVPESHLPISGTIMNITTGEKIEISSTREAKVGELLNPGAYVATLSTMPTKDGKTLSGDWRVFTFNFRIIPKGTAPGPVVNENKLIEYAMTSMVDSYPMYYGLTYSSAKGGTITLAFASKEAAKQYAYNYEKGTVEEQGDGTYRYTGSFVMAQKSKYVSAWDLTDAMDKFAEQAVQTLYFNMSDPFTYLTLDSAYANVKNPRTLELNNSVVLFADGEREKLCEKVKALPIISRKPCRYLMPGEFGSVRTDYTDFKFTKDKYGVDSNGVTITDCNGKEYPIKYQVGVGLQLMQQNCPSGVVTITETTCYGDTNTYEAVYIAENDNTSSLELTYYVGKDKKSETVTKADNGKTIEAGAFKIDKLIDDLDPYSIVTIENAEKSERAACYVADQETGQIWTEPGTYKVSVSNRLGYSYSVYVRIIDSEYVTLAFTGDETEGIDTILTMVGEKNVALPRLTRYGYELVGFEAEDGTVYTEEISQIAFKGATTLNAIWKAKEYTLTLQDENGDIYKTLTVEFGRKYELETPEVGEGAEFTGWLLDDKLVQNNEVAITEEGDIVLMASVKFPEEKDSIIAEEIDDEEELKEAEEKGSGWLLIVPIVIVAMVAVLLSVLIKKSSKRGSKEVSKDEKND